MTRLLEGRVAIVTGAGRGIGRAHALALAEAGAAVLVNGLGGGFRGEGAADPAPAESVVAEIRARGGRGVDRQDRGWYIAPSRHVPGPAPADAALAELDAVCATDVRQGGS